MGGDLTRRFSKTKGLVPVVMFEVDLRVDGCIHGLKPVVCNHMALIRDLSSVKIQHEGNMVTLFDTVPTQMERVDR